MGRETHVRANALLLAALLLIAARLSADEPELKTHEAKQAGFQVQAPAAWKVREPKGIAVLVLSVDGSTAAAGATPTFNVVFLKDAKSAIADIARGSQKAMIKDSPEAKCSDLEETTFAGEKAVKYTYTRKLRDQDAKGVRILILHNKNAYMIGFYGDPATYDAKAPDFEKVLSSWKWTE